MACEKLILKNNGSITAKFTYRGCANNTLYNNISIEPNEIKQIWAKEGTFFTDSTSIEKLKPTTITSTICTTSPSLRVTFSPQIAVYSRTAPISVTEWYIEGSSNFKMVVDWGDGIINVYENSNNYIPAHTYLTNDNYIASITFDNPNIVTGLNLGYNGGNGVSDIIGVNILTNLVYLYLYDNLISNFNPVVELPSTLKELDLSTNPITSFNPTYELPSQLEYLGLYGTNISIFDPTLPLPSTIRNLTLNDNNIEVFNPTLALPSNLENLILFGNQITEFNPSLPLPSNLLSIDLSNNLLTSFNPIQMLPVTLQGLNLSGNLMDQFYPNNFLPMTINNFNISNNVLTEFGVNNALVFLDSNGFTSGNFYLNGTGNHVVTSGPPDGLTALFNLISRGCSLFVNT